MEKLNERFTSGLTSTQLKKFGQSCDNCGQDYGSHQAGTFNCPKVPRDEDSPFRVDTKFSNVLAVTNPEIVAADAAGETLTIPLVPGERISREAFNKKLKSFGFAPLTDKVGRLVSFNQSRGVTEGRVVEAVPAGQLPTTTGLRHLTDKRRTPKPRDVDSYVVETSSRDAWHRVVSMRDRLCWPTSVTFV